VYIIVICREPCALHISWYTTHQPSEGSSPCLVGVGGGPLFSVGEYSAPMGWLHKPLVIYSNYKVCTISATDHIGHNHIGHTKRPYRPKGITISATKKIYCYLASTFISCQSETRNVVCNPVSHNRKVKERNTCRHISKRFDVSI